MLQQYLKVSRRGTGDWMMHQFSEAIIAAENRERQTLNIKKLKKNFRKNLLANAHIGGGQHYDFIVKQAVGTQDLAQVKSEIQFFTDLFKSKPQELIFLYREPYGYWKSAKKKFSHENDEMFIHYKRAFEAFKENGGKAIEYGDELRNFFKMNPLFKNVQIEEFSPKPVEKVEGLEKAENDYNNFISLLNEHTAH
jgi:hypothetical protein